MQHSHFNHPRRLSKPLAVAILAIATLSATSIALAAPQDGSPTLIRGPQGDVMQLNASASQRAFANSAASPFADAKRRAAVLPMVWNEDAKPDNNPQAALRAALPAQSSGDGRALSFANYMARNDFPEAWRAIDALTVKEPAGKSGEMMQPTDGAHYPYVRFPGNYYTSRWLVPPWNKIGKLYFNTPGGGSSYCTASVVSGTSVIATAAHCVYSRGQGFNSNFVFVPADRYGQAPYGRYGWQSATVLNDWINIGGRKHDVAVIRLAGEASSGQPVVNYVGWLGRTWNYGYEQYTYSHGYASNLSTQYTNVCAGTTYQSPAEGADVLVQGCDMTYGSSGGPWIINFTHNSHGGNHVNSVVSGPHIGAFGTAYVGARFTSNNIVPLCNAAGC